MTLGSGARPTGLVQSHHRATVPLYRTPLGRRIRVGGLVTQSGVPDPTHLFVIAFHAQMCGVKTHRMRTGGQKGPATRELSPGAELDVVDRDVVEGELEVVDGAHDGGVEAVGEDPGASNLLV